MNLETVEVTIANGASLSDAKAVNGSLVGIVMPSAWTAADLTFQALQPGSNTYGNLYRSSGTEVQFSAAASRFIAVDPIDFLAVGTIKVRSGTSGAAVNQAGERVIKLIVRRFA